VVEQLLDLAKRPNQGIRGTLSPPASSSPRSCATTAPASSTSCERWSSGGSRPSNRSTGDG